MKIYLCKAAAGFHYTDHEKQNKQGKPDCLYRTVDIQDGFPDTSALKLLWGLGDKLPNLRQFFIPCLKGIF